MASQQGPGCCGTTADKVTVIKQVSVALRDGHAGVADLYRKLAEDFGGKERAAFLAMAAEQEEMAVKSLVVLYPDSFGDDDSPKPARKVRK